jgi:alkylation response protein AidB-like acyl-CoA dehydrogenase
MSLYQLRLANPALPASLEILREEVRSFLADLRTSGDLPPPCKLGLGFSREITRKIAARGWIGMTWPRDYGGHARSALERYVVSEELLAAAVPVGAHWVGDRQSGPVLLKFGSETQKRAHLPAIAAGRRSFCIGMSEPSAGSDLAALRSRGDKVDGGWKINGQKLWTTNAHRADYMITLVRTAPGAGRHDGFSQMIIDLRAPGVTIRPVIGLPGDHDFNEVFFDDVLVGDDGLIGEPGNGWNQVSAELAYERSGPERWLSSFRILEAFVAALRVDGKGSDSTRIEIGRLVASLMALRQMSLSVAAMLEAGKTPNLQASIVKEVGTRFEQEMVKSLAELSEREDLTAAGANSVLQSLIESGRLYSPAFTIRGGAVEILRGIIAKGLGLR